MRTRTAGLTAMAATLLFLLVAGSASAANIAVFRAPVGDAGEAPDVQSLRVTNYTDGTLVLSLRIANRTSWSNYDEYNIFVDRGGDLSRTYWFRFVVTGEGGVLTVSRCGSGGGCEPVSASVVPREFGWSTGPFVQVNMFDLGLRFGDRLIPSVITSFGPEASDSAPAFVGAWKFPLERISDCGLDGTRGADVLEGTPGGDHICGHVGNDTVRGLGGNDRLGGGKGADLVVGGGGRDTLAGGPGADRLIAGPGADRIYARDGSRDVVRCGTGADVVVSRDPTDRLIGC